jgi:hypothetical protein
MEKLYFNLSEEEFTRGRKILIWVFFAAFFLGGLYVALIGPLFGINRVKPIFSLAPFGISLIVGLFAFFATIKRSDLYFLVDEDKIEFRYGLISPKKYSFIWNNIKEITMPQRERKIKVDFRDGTFFIINLSWIQRKKSTIIRKHIYHAAREKNLNVVKVPSLQGAGKK